MSTRPQTELEGIQRMLEAVHTPILVVTEAWEVAAVSRGVGQLVERTVPLGPGGRMGEALQCVHAEEGEGQCGERPACEWCRLMALVWAASKRDIGPVIEEVELTVRSKARVRRLALRAQAGPFWGSDQMLVAVSLEDLTEVRGLERKLADRNRALWRFHQKLEERETPEVQPVVERFGAPTRRCA